MMCSQQQKIEVNISLDKLVWPSYMLSTQNYATSTGKLDNANPNIFPPAFCALLWESEVGKGGIYSYSISLN